jgi:predicted DNA-binding transcriptional regulator AlpA
LLRLEASGSFPKRLRIGNTVTWLATEVREYIDGLAAKREAA